MRATLKALNEASANIESKVDGKSKADSESKSGRESKADIEPAVARSPEPEPKNRIRQATVAVLAVCAVVFAYGVVADRLTPYTDQATVQAYVVSIAPDVGGRVEVVNVIDNQAVNVGDILFEIDPERYAIEVKRAEAELATAGLNVGASTAALVSAQARLTEAKARLANAQTQSARTFSLVKQGIESKSQGELAKASLETALADVDRSTAEVEQARQNLGPLGADNPQIRKAMALLEKAKRDHIDTAMRAPSDGFITNLQLSQGQFVSAGQAVMTFVDREVIWIESQFHENSLEYIKPGNIADVVLDVHPGRVYKAEIESVSWGVDTREVNPSTGLPKVRNDKGWIRETQRFVVRVRFLPENRPIGIRIGSQANVVVYNGKSWMTDGIGRLWIVLISYLTYLS